MGAGGSPPVPPSPRPTRSTSVPMAFEAAATPPRRTLLDRMSLRAEPYLYSAPALFLIVTIMLVPLALGLSYAFRDVQLLNPFSGGFVGLDHFRALYGDDNF